MNLKEMRVFEEAKIKGGQLSVSVSFSGVLTMKCMLCKRIIRKSKDLAA